MAVVIRLDTEALKFLLEELGEEFVLELKGAVLKNALKAHISTVVSADIQKEIEGLAKLEVRAQIAEKPWERYPTLQQALRERIEGMVANETRDTIWGALHQIEVESIIAQFVESWAETVKRQVYRAMQEKVVKWAGEEVERRLSMLEDEPDGD